MSPVSLVHRLSALALLALGARAADFALLRPADFAPYADRFAAMAPETVVNAIPDAEAWPWLREQVPLFTCPDIQVEETYYFRWWSLRKHLVLTPAGTYAFTEFLNRPDPVSSAAGHHVMEARWLRSRRYVDDYARYWLRGGPGGTVHPKLHNYSEWLARALYSRYLVNLDTPFITSLLDDFVRNYALWDTERLTSSGLYWQYDVRDAMEESLSGSRTAKNLRLPLNCYQYGNAQSIAAIARLARRDDIARTFDAKTAALRRLVQVQLWDPAAQFFKVRLEDGTFSDAREAIGFLPWYFELPGRGRGFEGAWAQFADEAGFRAPFGVTTAERRHPRFRSHGVGRCEWDGAAWPFATTQTLCALANVLRDYSQDVVTSRDWFDGFLAYARSQRHEGKPFIGEYLDEKTGAWINRGDRSRDYLHSTFADLVINGLVGVIPRLGDNVTVAPLLPPATWDWFCLDGVSYHGALLTIVWDRDGEKFHRGRGLSVFVDGQLAAHSDQLSRLEVKLP